jgi:hypothetical protein
MINEIIWISFPFKKQPQLRLDTYNEPFWSRFPRCCYFEKEEKNRLGKQNNNNNNNNKIIIIIIIIKPLPETDWTFVADKCEDLICTC